MLRDVRDFCRSLWQDRFHWCVAILILGVAVGATGAVYTLMDRLVLHPLPIPGLNRVVLMGGLTTENLPTANPLDWWGQAHSLEYMAYSAGAPVTVQVDGWRGAERVDAVSNDFFRAFGVKIFRGRAFAHEDETPAGNDVAILSYAFWKRHYEGQRLPLGSIVQLNQVPYTVVGIAPRSLDGIGTGLWVPMTTNLGWPPLFYSSAPNADIQGGLTWFVGRLRKGATVAQVHGELMDLLHRLNTTYTPKTHVIYGEIVSVHTFQQISADRYRTALEALLAGAILILLIAGADCGGFLAGRAARRVKEVTIRRVLGASRFVVFRQALVEAAGLGLLSGLVGVAVAHALLLACQSEFPIYLVHLRDRTLIGPEVFFGCLGIGIVVGLLAGWLPGRKLATESVSQVMREDSGQYLRPHGKWLRVTLVVFQVALTFALVMGATLTIETARSLFGSGKGYMTRGVFAAQLSLPLRPAAASEPQKPGVEGRQRERKSESAGALAARTAAAEQDQSLAAEESEILGAAESMPTVSEAAFTAELPTSGAGGGLYTNVGGREVFLNVEVVSRDYFRTLGMKFLSGHTFSNSSANAVVIDALAAGELWPGKNPLGRTFTLEGEGQPMRVVAGVVNNTRGIRLVTPFPPPAKVYLPVGGFTPRGTRAGVYPLYLLLRCRAGCRDVTPSLVGALKRVGADSYINRVAPIDAYAGAITEPLWIRTSLLSFYALLGLALALGGVFVLTSYLSVTRGHEIGIRMALGAERGDLVMAIAKEGIISALVGLGAGAVLWFSAAQVLKNLIYGVTSLDPATFAAAGALLFLVTTLASILPALLAVTRQNPADLLHVV